MRLVSPPGVAAVRLAGCRRSFRTPDGGTYVALEDVDLEVRAGEFVALVGPTGCGKSTLLNLVAGLLPPDSGRVEVFGAPLTGLNRRAAYLFQQDVLLPWKTAEENVMLGLVFRRVPREEARRLSRAWLARVGLRGFENRYPHQLSGGMRKRVALAQNLIVNPEILLMDEPFAALDVQTRQLMENDLLRIWQEERKTVLFVTHDLEEAIALSDRVVVLSAGPAARPVGEFPVDLPRPRDVTEVRLDPRFAEVFRRIWELLRGEVMRAYGRAR
ncbi:Bicarbonate transport ATP-binding protein CmpD [bacterium HR32]|jgi:NitT/TauT family transport system ATP-binding protein|nr:Bicarbonate transport ATP-binding protein CmpD [bacterium HR32]